MTCRSCDNLSSFLVNECLLSSSYNLIFLLLRGGQLLEFSPSRLFRDLALQLRLNVGREACSSENDCRRLFKNGQIGFDSLSLMWLLLWILGVLLGFR